MINIEKSTNNQYILENMANLNVFPLTFPITFQSQSCSQVNISFTLG